jgi:hypothetical protein
VTKGGKINSLDESPRRRATGLIVARVDSETLIRIGPDEVVIADDGVVVLSPADMRWPVREFCRVPIWFRETRYYLRSKEFEATHQRYVYRLCHWPADHAQASSETIVYDDQYVAERDADSALTRNKERMRLFLLLFYPFLGMFWSDFKNRVLSPLGFASDSITRLSVFVSFNIFYVVGVFVGWLGGRDSLLLWGIMIIFGLDTFVRYSQSLKFDVQRHWGFLEWLWPWRKRG